MFQLGLFQLHERIGSGGMGSVWRATHTRQGVDAAVKLITAQHALDPEWQALFRHEVRSVARLAHRGIVTVFEYGEVPESFPDEEDIRRGAPFLAMELAAHGTLAATPPADWPQTRRALLDVLDALAHAHARGVIHRDLKPGNILIGGGRERTLKLTDFGLAGALDEAVGADEGRLAGTPRFMAPEQIRGTLRDQGPWTDLYALGSLAFWLVSGRAPYEGEREEILRGHLEGALPALQPRFTVPVAAEGWIHTLLAKDPAGRFEVCADAIHALLTIGDTADDVLEPVTGARGVSGHAETIVTHGTAPSAVSGGATTMRDVRPGPVAAPPGAWRRTEIPALSMKLIGTGLSLYDLRPVPVVDREEERDLIWEQLRLVQRDRSARAVIVRGGAGSGKSRLVEWVSQRAAELGAARVLRVRHSPYGGPIDGLSRMVAEDLRCVGLDRDEALRRIRRCEDVHVRGLELYDTLALAGVSSTSAAQADMFQSEEDWFAVLTRYLQCRARRRPVVLWIDDAHWGSEAIRFARHVLDAKDEAAVLVLMTVRDDLLTDQPDAQAALEALGRHSQCIERNLAPLEDRDQMRLVRGLLRLEPELADQVALRTAGNPLFAVQLVGDWVRRGILEVSESGFRIAGGEETALPQDIFIVWSSRFEQFLEQWPETERDAVRQGLELAAALGQSVDDAEWRVALDHAGLQLPGRVAETMSARGLAVGGEGGWAFCHGMLRESIEAGARSTGQWSQLHVHCATMLQNLYGRDRLRHAKRLTQHLLEAGDLAAAKDTLLDVAEQACRLTHFDEAERTYEKRNEILDALGIAAGDVERVRTQVERARHGLRSGRERMDVVQAQLEEASALAESAQISDPAVLGLIEWVRSRLARHRGVPDEALEPARRALELYQQAGDREGIAAVQKTRGENLRRVGRLDEALASYRDAQRYYEEQGDLFQVGWCQYGRAVTLKQAAELEEAELLLQEAAENFERSGGLLALGPTFNERGELARWRGDLEAAERFYWKGLRAMPPGYSDVGIARLNLGYVALERDDFDRAGELLDAGAADLVLAGRTGATVYAHAGKLVCIAGRRQWLDWDDCFGQVVERLQHGLLDRDIAQVLERAAVLCEEHGQKEYALSAYDLAETHWGGLGEADAAARVSKRRAALESG